MNAMDIHLLSEQVKGFVQYLRHLWFLLFIEMNNSRL